MNRKTRKALEKSIEHWEIDVLKNNVFPEAKNCPLCTLFYGKIGKSCKGCPVSEKTGLPYCINTPYQNLVYPLPILEQTDTIMQEIAFLESLLE